MRKRMTRTTIRDLDPSNTSQISIKGDDVFYLDKDVLIKEHAYNIKGTALLIPKRSFHKILNEHAVLMLEMLDGIHTVSEVTAHLASKLGISYHEVWEGGLDFYLAMLQDGVLLRSQNKTHHPVRKFLKRTTYSLDTLELVLTQKCNLDCIYCSREESLNEMSPSLCSQIIESIVNLGISNVLLTGGEPILHPMFWKIVDELSKNSVAVTVFTNGALLSDEDVSKFAELGVVGVCLSVDSLDDADLELLGQRKSSSIHLVELFRYLKDADIRVRVNNILVPGINCAMDKVDSLIEVFDDSSAGNMAFSEVLPVEKGRDYPPDVSVFEAAAYIGKRMNIPRKGVERWVGRIPDNNLVEPHVPRTVCGVGTHLTTVFPDGRVNPCIQQTDIVAGWIGEQDLEEIWESSDTWELFRRRESLESLVCLRCPDWNVCLGGCKAKARFYGDTMASPDLWSCALFGHLHRPKNWLSHKIKQN